MTTDLGEIVQPTLTTLLILEKMDLRSNKYLCTGNDLSVSSTKIRNAISEGNMPLANEYLVTIFYLELFSKESS
jgi:FAD synthase